MKNINNSIFLLLLSVLFFTGCKTSSIIKSDVIVTDPNIVYYVWEVDVVPTFPDGNVALSKYLHESFFSSFGKFLHNFNDEFCVLFTIEKNGSVSNISFPRKFTFEDKLKEVLNGMPNWKPGTINSQPVKTRMSFPFILALR